MKSKYEADMIHIVTEIVDGKPVKTRLPKEKAETLFRKIRSKGGEVSIQKECLEKVEEPYINGFEVEA